MAILVTGGAGYIGTHALVELSKAGYEYVVLDNFCNSDKKALERVEELTGKKVMFYEGDIADSELVEKIINENSINACMHFAGLKAVGESVEKPLMYFKNNVIGSIKMLDVLLKHGIKKIIFSSSATVYGEPETMPITEDFPKGETTNPYGRTKSIFEDILMDTAKADQDMTVVLLRYFNPVGAHESGKIGEDPEGIPNNLMPFITQVAVGKREKLRVFGDDYNTPDGTGVRDFIHVTDLVDGHVKALSKIGVLPDREVESDKGTFIYNLGTGKGTSVLELVKAFEEANGVKVPYEITDRRPGDVAVMYCDASKAEKELGWKAERDITKMCADAWNWQKNNPEGYKG